MPGWWEDELYPNGYLIEHRVPGIAADKTRLYVRLTELVSCVHGIRIRNFGYIGSGTASHRSLIDFLDEEFDGLKGRLEDSLEASFVIHKQKSSKQRDLSLFARFMQSSATPITHTEVSGR